MGVYQANFFPQQFSTVSLPLSLDFLPRGAEVVQFCCQSHAFAILGPESAKHIDTCLTSKG